MGRSINDLDAQILFTTKMKLEKWGLVSMKNLLRTKLKQHHAIAVYYCGRFWDVLLPGDWYLETIYDVYLCKIKMNFDTNAQVSNKSFQRDVLNICKYVVVLSYTFKSIALFEFS